MPAEQLPVPLTQREIQSKAESLGQKIAERDAYKESSKDIAKGRRDNLNDLDTELRQTAREIVTKQETRLVEVTYVPSAMDGVMRTVRKDTGETIHTRALSDRERDELMQGKIFDAPADEELPMADMA